MNCTYLNVGCVRIAALHNGHREALHEGEQSAELAGKDKVKERPELAQVVLNGRAAENDAMRCAKALGDDGDLGLGVADLVALVEHHEVPVLREQRLVVDQQGRVGGEQHAVGGRTHGAYELTLVAAHRAHLVQDAHPQPGPPAMQLGQPLAEQRHGRHDERRSAASRMMQRGDKGGHLHRLAEAHLVAEYAAAALRVQLAEPRETGALERVQTRPDAIGHADCAAGLDLDVVAVVVLLAVALPTLLLLVEVLEARLVESLVAVVLEATRLLLLAFLVLLVVVIVHLVVRCIFFFFFFCVVFFDARLCGGRFSFVIFVLFVVALLDHSHERDLLAGRHSFKRRWRWRWLLLTAFSGFCCFCLAAAQWLLETCS